jgi:hypothetical protein
MLATLVPEPFDRPGWVYEEKYDGDRASPTGGTSGCACSRGTSRT